MGRVSRRGGPRALEALVPRGRYTAAALCALALGVGSALAFPYAVDDAYIVVRYAVRLAHGAGYTFNDGPATDGVTSPLWLAIACAAAWLGAPLAPLKVVGALATCAAALTALHAARARSRGRLAGLFCAVACATSAPLVVWGVGGLETGLATLCATLIGVSAWRGRGDAAARVALLCVPWLRPELVPFALCAGVFAPRVGRVRAAAWLCAGLASVALFRALLFGHVLPMTAAAKPGELRHGVGYVRDALLTLPALSALALACLAQRVRRARALLAALAVHALAVLLAGGDWMPAARLFVPVTPCVLLLASTYLARAAVRRPRSVALVALILLLVRGAAFGVDVSAARVSGALREQGVRALARVLPSGRGPIVALDVGILSSASDAELVDLGGLTEPRIAYARGGHLDKRLDGAWLEARAARAIVLHSADAPRSDAQGNVRWFAGYPVERRVLALPWVRRDYRLAHVTRYDARYYYLVLVPRSASTESVKR